MDDVTAVLSLSQQFPPCLTNALETRQLSGILILGWWPAIHNDTRTRGQVCNIQELFFDCFIMAAEGCSLYYKLFHS